MASKPKDRGRWGGKRGVAEDRRRRKEVHREKERGRGDGKGSAEGERRERQDREMQRRLSVRECVHNVSVCVGG